MIDLIVIGGGIAGLTAARDSARLGVKVTVLEGRSRIGGQIYSVPHPIITDQVHFGAEWYSEFSHSSFQSEVSKYGLKTTKKEWPKEYHLKKTKNITATATLKTRLADDGSFDSAIKQINADMSLIDVKKGFDQYEIDFLDIPLATYFNDRLKLRGEILNYFLTQSFLLCGADPEHYSALAMLLIVAELQSAERVFGFEVKGQHYTKAETKRYSEVNNVPQNVTGTVTAPEYSATHDSSQMSASPHPVSKCTPHALTNCGGTMDRLVQSIYNEIIALGGKVRLNCPVASVTADEVEVEVPKVPNYDYPSLPRVRKLVRIRLQSGEEIVSRAAMVAVPIRCLPLIKFSPPLPGSVTRACSVCNTGDQHVKVWAYVSGISMRIDRVLSSDHTLKDCYVAARHRHSLDEHRVRSARSPAGRRSNARVLSPIGSRRSSRRESPVPPPTPGSRAGKWGWGSRGKGNSTRIGRQQSPSKSPPKSPFFPTGTDSVPTSPAKGNIPISSQGGSMGKEKTRAESDAGAGASAASGGVGASAAGGGVGASAAGGGVGGDGATRHHKTKQSPANGVPNERNFTENWSDIFEMDQQLVQQELQQRKQLAIMVPSSPYAPSRTSGYGTPLTQYNDPDSYVYALVCGVGLRDQFLSRLQTSFTEVHPGVQFPLPHLQIEPPDSTPAFAAVAATVAVTVEAADTAVAASSGNGCGTSGLVVDHTSFGADAPHRGLSFAAAHSSAAGRQLQEDLASRAIIYHDFAQDRFTHGSWFALRAGTGKTHALAVQAALYPWAEHSTTDRQRQAAQLPMRREMHQKQVKFVPGRSTSMHRTSMVFNPTEGKRHPDACNSINFNALPRGLATSSSAEHWCSDSRSVSSMDDGNGRSFGRDAMRGSSSGSNTTNPIRNIGISRLEIDSRSNRTGGVRWQHGLQLNGRDFEEAEDGTLILPSTEGQAETTTGCVNQHQRQQQAPAGRRQDHRRNAVIAVPNDLATEPEWNHSLMLIGSELHGQWTGWVEGGIRSGTQAALAMHKYLYPPRIERNLVRRVYPDSTTKVVL